MSLFEKYKLTRESVPMNESLEEDLVPCTVRLPKTTLAKIDFIKDELKETRQAVLSDILSDGVNEAFQGCLVGAGYSEEQFFEITRKIQGYADDEEQKELDV